MHNFGLMLWLEVLALFFDVFYSMRSFYKFTSSFVNWFIVKITRFIGTFMLSLVL